MEFKSYGIEAINEDYEKQILTEETVYTEGGFGIGVFPLKDRNFIQDPYIKVYNASTITKASKLVRIGILNIRFIRHRDSRQFWILNTKQLKYINKIMRTKNESNETYWEQTLRIIGADCVENPLYFEDLFNIIPDFTEAKKHGY